MCTSTVESAAGILEPQLRPGGSRAVSEPHVKGRPVTGMDATCLRATSFPCAASLSTVESTCIMNWSDRAFGIGKGTGQPALSALVCVWRSTAVAHRLYRHARQQDQRVRGGRRPSLPPLTSHAWSRRSDRIIERQLNASVPPAWPQRMPWRGGCSLVLLSGCQRTISAALPWATTLSSGSVFFAILSRLIRSTTKAGNIVKKRCSRLDLPTDHIDFAPDKQENEGKEKEINRPRSLNDSLEFHW